MMIFDATLKEYLHEIDEAPLLSLKEEQQLGMEIIERNEPIARERLVRSNLRLVVNMAKRYAGRGLGISDLIEEGNLGLIKAVDYFDPRRGTRFSTYASWWIKQSIKHALLRDVQPVHIPTYMVALINQWRHTAAELESKIGKEPTIADIADIMHIPLRKAKAINEIVQVLSGIQDETSDSDLEQDSQLESIIGDESFVNPEHSLSLQEEQQKAVRLLDEIEPREAAVLRLHYGIGQQKPVSLKEIGRKLNLTRERIRQIQRSALSKLYEYMNLS